MELSLTSGIAQLLTEISTKLINEREKLAGEGSELRGPKSAYFGCFSPSSPEMFAHFSYSLGRETNSTSVSTPENFKDLVVMFCMLVTLREWCM